MSCSFSGTPQVPFSERMNRESSEILLVVPPGTRDGVLLGKGRGLYGIVNLSETVFK